MKYTELDTPTLLIDREILVNNLRYMKDYANANGIVLRPHTKTHKMPFIAKMQIEIGASGIAVAMPSVHWTAVPPPFWLQLSAVPQWNE